MGEKDKLCQELRLVYKQAISMKCYNAASFVKKQLEQLQGELIQDITQVLKEKEEEDKK